MAVNGSVATKDQRCIGLVGGVKLIARKEIDTRQNKWA
jgi:hypothetical protein